MATISQLMEGKAPGSVKVRSPRWSPRAYFAPYFQTKEGWYGADALGGCGCWDDLSDDWTLYPEPKRKVAMYLWAVRTSTETFLMPNLYYASEEALRADFRSITWCQRLDYTKIEVEEDV